MAGNILKFEQKNIASPSEKRRQQRIEYLKSSIDVFLQVGRHDLARVAQTELADQIEIQMLYRSV